MRRLLLVLIAVLVASAALAQQQPSMLDGKIATLLNLLDDPELQSWLRQRRSETPVPAASITFALEDWEAFTRGRIEQMISAVPRILPETAATSERVWRETAAHDDTRPFLLLVGAVVIGALVEWRSHKRFSDAGSLAQAIPTLLFLAVATTGYFARDWPTSARLVLLAFLVSLAAYRLGAILVDHAFAVRMKIRGPARLMLAMILLAIALSLLGGPLGMDPATSQAISYCFSLALLLVAILVTWWRLDPAPGYRHGLTFYLVILWLLWALDLQGLFWLALYLSLLPGLIEAAGRATASLLPLPAGDPRRVLATRAGRALVIALAIGWLALIWHFNTDAFTRRNPWFSALFTGFLKSIVVLLVIDCLWQLAKNIIDRKLSTAIGVMPGDGAYLARQARLRTLLPLLRNALAVLFLVLAGMLVLAELGVDIAPLIAGAGIFGVAVGFGSQTLVRDVISGVFYMLDDAFRVGEYIQANSYKGTVESFSLRSVRLRHHRGPVFTVPFGQLGAVENMSRDWSIVKFVISVDYDTDLQIVKAVTRAIAEELRSDPEFSPHIIETLKLKGVERFGEYGIDLSFGMTLRPGDLQSMIRRRAYALIHDRFRENAIAFARPTYRLDDKDKERSSERASSALQVEIGQHNP